MSFYRAFTKYADGITKSLISEVCISPYPVRDRSSSEIWTGLWDTGADVSCISPRVVSSLHLLPAGKRRVSTANGFATANTYLVNIMLPSQVELLKLLVPCLSLGANIDVLLGMDIISFGDFAISNFDGKTAFSFRIPSLSVTDFVQEHEHHHFSHEKTLP